MNTLAAFARFDFMDPGDDIDWNSELRIRYATVVLPVCEKIKLVLQRCPTRLTHVFATEDFYNDESIAAQLEMGFIPCLVEVTPRGPMADRSWKILEEDLQRQCPEAVFSPHWVMKEAEQLTYSISFVIAASNAATSAPGPL